MPQLDKITFSLRPLAPFRLDLTSWTLQRRRTSETDRFDGVRYRRGITLGEKVILLTACQFDSTEKSRLQVQVEGVRINSDELRLARRNLETLLGLQVDLTGFYSLARTDPKILELAKRFRGAKPPRFPSIFEALLNAISCQQVSFAVGLLILDRLVQRYGRKVNENDPSAQHAFPLPQDLSNLKPNNLRQLGFSTQKSNYIIGLARLIVNKGLDPEEITKLRDEEALKSLQSIPGIGRWSSEYALLRGLGRLNIFPADDVGAQNGLEKFLHLRKKPDYERTIQLVQPYQPYSGLIYFHLLLNRLEKEGTFQI